MNRRPVGSFLSLHARGRVLFNAAAIVFALTLANSPRFIAHAAPGDLDLTFGSGGKALTDMFGANDAGFACALQADAKIIVVGSAFVGDRTKFALARYEANGSLDGAFGIGGKVATDFFGDYNNAAAVRIQPDGKIVVGGSAGRVNAGADYAIARYNPDGSLDNSFGSGGEVTTDFLGYQDQIWAIRVQADGKIIAAGTSYVGLSGTSISLARYNSDGSIDAGFGSSGKVLTSAAGHEVEGASSMEIQRDGKIVVAGYVVSGVLTTEDFALVRFNYDGSLDSSFGSAGRVATDFGTPYEGASSIVIQSDGRIIAGGTRADGVHSSFALARYRENGSLDPTYGVGGKVVTITDSGENLTALALQPDGRLIAAGGIANSISIFNADFCLRRYAIDGSLDASFGNNGKISTDLSGDDDALLAVLLQPDGKIIAAGFSIVNGGEDFAIARYDGGPPFDLCLQDDSNGNLLQVSTTTGDYRFSNCSGLNLSGAGALTKRGGMVTLQRYAADHRLLATIDASVNKGTASIQVFSLGATLTITDRNVANSICTCTPH